MSEYAVRRYDYPAQFPDLDGELLPRIRRMLLDGEYILGPAVQQFEESFASYIGVQHAVGVNSGTDALILALHALGIGPGDEVITVANTFHATAMAIARVGATPVLVDCRPDTYLMDLDQLPRVVTPRTRAIIAVHLFGQAMPMADLKTFADRHGLLVIEDCAQAIGARGGGRRVGSLSHAGCWSFAPAKNLAAAGDGGMITLDDPAVADSLRLLRHFGQRQQNDHRIVGFNSRLDTIQALVLSHKLPHMDAWNDRRRQIAQEYRQRLANVPVSFQECDEADAHVHHLFQVRTSERDALLAHLQRMGVDAVVRYPYPVHLQAAFADLGYRAGDFPVAEDLAANTLCLPLHPSMTEGEIDLVCSSVAGYFQTALASQPRVASHASHALPASDASHASRTAHAARASHGSHAS
jgi:dTDP-4-amino-4,6-dideoxygalactose transaminase